MANREAHLDATNRWLQRPAAEREAERRRQALLARTPHQLRSYSSRACAERYPLRADPLQSRA
eukprot:5786620-Prymnesium_polylepis.1